MDTSVIRIQLLSRFLLQLVDSLVESTHDLLSMVQDKVYASWLDSIIHHTAFLLLSVMGEQIMSGFAALVGCHDDHRKQLHVSFLHVADRSSALALIFAEFCYQARPKWSFFSRVCYIGLS